MPHVKISTSRADVPIRVRKRIVDVEGGPDVETVVAIRAPNEEGPGSACENPCLQAYSFISFLKIQLCGAVPHSPRRLRRYGLFISKSRAEVPIRVRKRIVDVEGGPDEETVVATRAPKEEVELRRREPATIRLICGF